MRKIKIFISAAADGLKPDIAETEAFIFRLNNCYIDRGLYFAPLVGDEISEAARGAVNIGGHSTGAPQLALADSALAFFLVEAHDTELPETYKTALNSYNKTGKPKISVYTKTQWSSCRGDYQSVCKTLFARKPTALRPLTAVSPYAL